MQPPVGRGIGGAVTDKDAHKQDLLAQIEAKKRERQMEIQREKEQDDRERQKFEQHMARVKAEAEEVGQW